MKSPFQYSSTLLAIVLSIVAFGPCFGQKKNKKTIIEKQDPMMFQSLKYRSVGPTRGGRATAITGIPEKPYTFFMGPTGGGIWKTNDAGMSWKNISDGQIKAGSIGAIEVAPSDINVIYVGTGSVCPRGNISPGIGMYKSTDGGDSWQFSGLPEAGQIGKIIIHPTNPDMVYVAALGNIFKSNPERGIFRSKNGGKSWEKILFVSDSTGAIDLLINPENPRIMYAAMWRAQRKPWTLIDGGKEGGIWMTKDAGESWQKLSGGLPSGIIGRIGLTISPANPSKVWALIQAKEEKDGGIYRSDNGGKSWKKINRDHKLRQRGWYYSHITAHPKDENTVFVSNTGFYKSIDGGKTFDIRLRTQHGDNHGVWINPNNPEIMINCNDGGANISLNGGSTWSTQTNQPTAEFYRITTDNQFPYRLYAGQQDNTTISVPSHDPGDLHSIQQWYSVGGGESGDVAVDPRDPNMVYAGTYSGEITYTDLNKWYNRQLTAYPHYTEGTEQRDLKYRWQWNFPIAINPHNPDEVYHTSNYVHKSTDKGQTWEIISPDLTQDLDQYQGIPGGPVQHDATGVEVYSSIFSFEISPHQNGVMWAGSDDGLIHLTQDAGKTWQNITPPDMPSEGTVNKIELSNHTPGRALIAVYRYRDGDFSPYIFLTENFGGSWKLLTTGTNGIPRNHFVRAIAEDPVRKGLLFAGTEFGMYVSFNEGKSWQDFQLNLPHVPITDMEIVHNDLAISTQGRSFWILDDITPLREDFDQISQKQSHLFSPGIAYRTQLREDYDARIHYYLKEKPDSTNLVEITIVDPIGNDIITFANSGEESNTRKIREMDKGLNLISWNLRYPGPEIVEDLVTMVISNPVTGKWAVPGKYRVKLKTEGYEESVELSVEKDPRWDFITQGDLEEQYQLCVEIESMISESHAILKNIRAIRTQVQDISKRVSEVNPSNEIKIPAEEFSKEITELENKIIQTKAESSQDNINYPRVFSNHIGRVYSVATYGHGKPTNGVLERFTDVKIEYQEILDGYNQIIDQDLPNFVSLLEKEGVDRIMITSPKKE